MYSDYFKAYALDLLYNTLITKFNMQVTELSEGYFKFTNENCICFINLLYGLHCNVDYSLGIDNIRAFNKISQLPVSIDLSNYSLQDVEYWVEFLSSEEGYNYSNSFEYLNDESRPCYIYKEN